MLNEALEPLEAKIEQIKTRLDGLITLYHILGASKATQKKVVFAQIEECEGMMDQINIAIDAVIELHLKGALDTVPEQ